MVSSCGISVLMTSVFSVTRKKALSQEQGGSPRSYSSLCRRAKNFNLKVILMGLSLDTLVITITFI